VSVSVLRIRVNHITNNNFIHLLLSFSISVSTSTTVVVTPLLLMLLMLLVVVVLVLITPRVGVLGVIITTGVSLSTAR
jgi:hypothetical protein